MTRYSSHVKRSSLLIENKIIKKLRLTITPNSTNKNNRMIHYQVGGKRSLKIPKG